MLINWRGFFLSCKGSSRPRLMKSFEVWSSWEKKLTSLLLDIPGIQIQILRISIMCWKFASSSLVAVSSDWGYPHRTIIRIYPLIIDKHLRRFSLESGDAQTEGRTDRQTDATKYIISVASRSINTVPAFLYTLPIQTVPGLPFF